jgi:CRP/FNR family cyclic AMP-dependent transcriptional regulator
MEFISRILDGSISYTPRGEPRGRSFFGGRVSQDDKIDRLEEVGLLAECSRRQLRAIARISEVIEVPEDTVLARSGAAGEEFFLILDGSARVEVSPRKRSRLKPGEYFGEMSLLDGGPRSASVIAETPLRLLVIKRRDFSTLLREAPELTQSLLATLSRRLRHAEASLTTD